MRLECIATTLTDSRTIEANGGSRIELVSGLSDGGFTPSDGLVRAVQATVKIPVAVMLRTNQEGFHYSKDDLAVMRRDALRFHELGVRHIVTGLLDENGIADIEALDKLIAGTDYQVTFHRAIDASTDVAASLDRINVYPRITHILTSLGPGTVEENFAKLGWYAENTRPKLILGSGINQHNIRMIAEGAKGYHYDMHVGTAIRQGRAMNPVDGEAVSGLIEQVREFLAE